MNKILLFVPCDFHGIDEGRYEMSEAVYNRLKKVVSKLTKDNYADPVSEHAKASNFNEHQLHLAAHLIREYAKRIPETYSHELCVVPEQVQLFEDGKAVAGYNRG